MELKIRVPKLCSINQWIRIFAAFLTISFMVYGLIAYLPYHGILLWLLSFSVWFVFAYSGDAHFLGRFFRFGGMVILFYIILFLFDLANGNPLEALSNSYINTYVSLIMMVAFYCFYEKKVGEKETQILFDIVLIEESIKIPVCIKLFLSDPLVARRLMDPTIDNQDITYSGMAPSFTYVYFVLFLVLTLLPRIKKVDGIRKIWYSYVCVAGCLMILNGSFATATLMLILGIFLVLFAKNVKIVLGLSTIGILFVLLFSQIGAVFFRWLSSMWNFSSIVQKKLYQISMFIATGAAGESTMMDRLRRIQMCLDAINKHPLMGVYSMNVSDATNGGHTYWFDIFALFGLIRVFPLIAFYIGWFIKVVKARQISFGNKNVAVLVVVVISGFFNPTICEATAPIIFFLMPLADNWCREKSKI